jgi:WD40 repeat protein
MITNESPFLATAGYDNTIRFWDVNSGHNYRTVQHNDGVFKYSFESYTQCFFQ